MNEPLSSKAPVLVVGLLLVIAISFAILEFSGKKMPAEPLKIGTNVWLGYEPLYLARELGYLDNNAFRLVEFASATQTIRAYRNNAIQVAALTLDEVLLLLESGLDPRVILVMDTSNGGDAILAKPNIKNLEDLRGRNVGVESTALGAFFLNQALETVGLHPSDVNIVSAEIDEHERVFLDGDVDAVVTFEPVRSHLLAKGAHSIFESSQIPGEIVDVLVVAKDTFERYPEEIEALLKGWFKALDHINTRPKEAAVLMGPRLKLSPEQVLTSLNGIALPSLGENLQLLSGPEAPLKKTATKLADVMLKNRLLQQEVELENFVHSSALKNVEVAVAKASFD